MSLSHPNLGTQLLVSERPDLAPDATRLSSGVVSSTGVLVPRLL